MISNISKYIRHLREQSQLSQIEVAERAGLSVRHYQDIEYGNRDCRLDTVTRILDVYNVSLLNFFDTYLIDEFYSLGAESFAKLVDSVEFGYLRFRRDGLITDCNDVAARLTGRSLGEIVNRRYIWESINSPAEQAFSKGLVNLVAETKAQPPPWTGELAGISGGSKLIRVYWRHLTPEPGGDISDFEMIVLPIGGVLKPEKSLRRLRAASGVDD